MDQDRKEAIFRGKEILSVMAARPVQHRGPNTDLQILMDEFQLSFQDLGISQQEYENLLRYCSIARAREFFQNARKRSPAYPWLRFFELEMSENRLSFSEVGIEAHEYEQHRSWFVRKFPHFFLGSPYREPTAYFG